jgi:exodeoxyribonuclease-5
MLSEEQEYIHDYVYNNINTEKRILINGSAGTGKTYLAASIIETYIQKTSKRILVTAPTHEALNVLKTKLKHIHSNKVDYATIQSALQLKRIVNNHTGKITFKKDLYAKTEKPIYKGDYYICIIDESSMLESNLVAAIEALGDVVNVIFLADIKQINPVGEDISPVFTMGYDTQTLTVPQRQSADNPILDISLNPNKLALKTSHIVGTNGYIFDNDLDKIVRRIVKGNGDVVYLGWTNKQVNYINSLVRKKIYGTPQRFMLGESVIFDRPYKKLYYNRQKTKIESIEVITHKLKVPSSTVDSKLAGNELVGCLSIPFKLYRINNNVLAVHEDSIQAFLTHSEKVKKECEAKTLGWKFYYAFLEQVASLKYTYAITTHTSQGSTFFCTIVDVGDIYKNPNRKEAARLLYTATTRSSNITIFYNT